MFGFAWIHHQPWNRKFFTFTCRCDCITTPEWRRKRRRKRTVECWYCVARGWRGRCGPSICFRCCTRHDNWDNWKHLRVQWIHISLEMVPLLVKVKQFLWYQVFRRVGNIYSLEHIGLFLRSYFLARVHLGFDSFLTRHKSKTITSKRTFLKIDLAQQAFVHLFRKKKKYDSSWPDSDIIANCWRCAPLFGVGELNCERKDTASTNHFRSSWFGTIVDRVDNCQEVDSQVWKSWYSGHADPNGD